IGVPDSVTAVLLHGLVLPLAYALVCALVTKVALRLPVVRIAFGEVPVGVPAPVQLRTAVPVGGEVPVEDTTPGAADVPGDGRASGDAGAPAEHVGLEGEEDPMETDGVDGASTGDR